MSVTPPVRLQLVPALESAPSDKPDELRGVLEAVLVPELGVAVARTMAEALVVTAAYDCPEALSEITPEALSKVGIPAGRHTRVCRALFGPTYVSASASASPGIPTGVMAAPPLPVINIPAPVVNVIAPSAERSRAPRAAWPMPDSRVPPPPEVFTDFGMALRVFLRDSPAIRDPAGALVGYTPEQWAETVWERFSNPWSPMPAGHQTGGAHDKMLCAALLSAPGALPRWATTLVRQ